MDSCARGAPWIGTGFPASGFLALPNWVQAASISNSAVATTRIRVGRRGARNALVCIGCSWCLGRRVGQTLDIGFLRHTIQTQAFASHQRDAPWYKHESARIGLDRRECSPAALYGSEPGSSNWYVDQQEPMRDSTAWKTMVRPERLLAADAARPPLRYGPPPRRARQRPTRRSAGLSNSLGPRPREFELVRRSARTDARFHGMENDGAPGEIRTPGLLVRSQALYPTELRAHAEGRAYYHIDAPAPAGRR